MFRKPLTITLTALAVGALSFASLTYTNGQNQSEMNRQAYRDFQKEDKALNVVYQKLTKELGAKDLVRLKRAQNAWIAFRDAEAEFKAGAFEGGTMAPTIRYGSMGTLTKKRTMELRESLKEFGER